MLKVGRCKHFNGIQNTHCKAGVCYDDVTPGPKDFVGKAFRLPCMILSSEEELNLQLRQYENYQKKGTCEKYCEPTLEEIKQDEDELEESIRKKELGI